MKYLKYLFLLFATTITTSSEKIIKNINYPSCRNCVYYKPSFFTTDYASSTSKCEKFGEKNILTGEITYNYVEIPRKDEFKCGKEGKYFEEERRLNMKIFTHFIISNFPNTILISFIVIYLVVSLKVYT